MTARKRQCTRCGRSGPWLSEPITVAKLHAALTCLEVARDELELLGKDWPATGAAAGFVHTMRDFDFRRAAQGIIDVIGDREGVCVGCSTGRGIASSRQRALAFGG